MKLRILAAMAVVFAVGIAVSVLTVLNVRPVVAQSGVPQTAVPKFEPDPYWPKQLPNNWMLGQVAGIYVDSRDHVWVTSRPRTLDDNDKYAALSPPQADCCIPAPPVIEFDAEGNFVQGWGGPDSTPGWSRCRNSQSSRAARRSSGCSPAREARRAPRRRDG